MQKHPNVLRSDSFHQANLAWRRKWQRDPEAGNDAKRETRVRLEVKINQVGCLCRRDWLACKKKWKRCKRCACCMKAVSKVGKLADLPPTASATKWLEGSPEIC